VDLPADRISGLVEAEKILRKNPNIRFVHLSEVDVIRHPVVQDIIKAYALLDREKTTRLNK